MIKKETVIKKIDEVLDFNNSIVNSTEVNRALEIVKTKVLNTPNDDSWIPVSERLPEGGRYVFVCDDKYNYFIANYYKSKWHYENGDCIDGKIIIAWHPLPEPYKEEK